MKSVILAFAIAMMISFTAYAEEITVGAAPDPYEAIWATATDEDILALCRVCYWESARADAPIEVTEAVVETVLNRCLSGEWADGTIKGVCEDREYGRQFVCKYYDDTSHDAEIAEAIEHVKANGRTVLPDYDYVYFATRIMKYHTDPVYIGLKRKYGGMYFAK